VGGVEKTGGRVDEVDPEIGKEGDPVGEGDPGGPEQRASPEHVPELADPLDEREALRPLRASIAPDQQIRSGGSNGLREVVREGGSNEQGMGTDGGRTPDRPDDFRRGDRVLEVDRAGSVRELKVTEPERRLHRTQGEAATGRTGGTTLQEGGREQRELTDRRSSDQGETLQPLDGPPHDSSPSDRTVRA